jgi:SAM-dependent methyltransferase
MECPLCKSTNVALVERIKAGDLIGLYKSKFKLDTSYLFKSAEVDYVLCADCRLKFFYPFSGGDGAFYTYFQKYDWYYMEEKEEFVYARNLVKPEMEVLEIGSGKGIFAKNLSSRKYTGLEFSNTACELAARDGIDVRNESIENHALTNRGKYDVVCFFQVLEHVQNIGLFLSSAVACLKTGGTLIISVPHDDSFVGQTVNAYLNLPPHHASRWNDEPLKSIARLFNLELVELYRERLSPNHQRLQARSAIEGSIREKLNIKKRVVDVSMRQNMIKAISFVAAKIAGGRILEKHRAEGHSVVAVYTKK